MIKYVKLVLNSFSIMVVVLFLIVDTREFWEHVEVWASYEISDQNLRSALSSGVNS